MLTILFVLFSTLSSAQKKINWEGTKLSLVTIVDPGRIYALYVMSTGNLETLSNHCAISEDAKTLITNNSTEDKWPEKMGALNSRAASKEIIHAYSAYLVCSFDDKYLLVIPSKLNRDMPDGFKSDEDFFMIIGNSGVKTSVKN